jgi:glucose-1-phosphate adenylyltransferase
MDYGPMIAYHVEKGADITVGVVSADRGSEGIRVLTVTEVTTRHPIRGNRRFDPMPGRTDVALASMGIYVFNPELLEAAY